MSTTHKLVFIGEPGAGKTTCIAALSDMPPLHTDVGCTDALVRVKKTTTVAFDYGEMDLGELGRLLLYGLPGQARFRFMFDIVREGLLGVVILVDASTPRALEGLRETLEAYARDLQSHSCVVALNKHPAPSPELQQQCLDLLQQHALVAPVVCVDARRREDIVRIFTLLFLLLEHAGEAPQEDARP
jgi:signal recognition particle receptor subunit beta